MIKKNHPVTDINGEEVWISRAMCCVSFIFKQENGIWKILAEQRGPGAASCKGMWGCPGGYLDFNERLQRGAARELAEETGLLIEPISLYMCGIDDEPNGNHQNVTFRFTNLYGGTQWDLHTGELTYTPIPETPMPLMFDMSEHQIEGGEEDEVSDIKWIPLNEIGNYKWAFNHVNIIKTIVKTYHIPVQL